MREQIEALRKLQAQDHQVVKLERRMVAIPKRLAEMDHDLGKLENLLSAERHKLDESRKFKARLELQRQEDEQNVHTSKNRVSGIKNARELAAAQREVEAAKRSAQNRVEEIADMVKAIEAAEMRIAQVEQSLLALRGQFSDERERLIAERVELEGGLNKHATARQGLASRVERALLAEYERVRARAGGIAFVSVREQRCGGCKIQVPHRVYVSLRNADSIPACENCGRLLYWAGLFSAEHTPRPEDAGLPMPAAAATNSASKAKPSPSGRKVSGSASSAPSAKPGLPSRPPAPRKAAVPAKGTKSASRESASNRSFRLGPKPTPEKVVNDPMQIEGEAPERLPEMSAPKPAPTAKGVVTVGDN